ncbi:MAG: sugar ABC transporter permease, partial [Lachnospiraceae bacterium]|nr:sugar ABC transporter permease [Lachnospiraceae bacterium]
MAKDGNSKDNVKKYFEVVKEGFVEIGSIFKKGDWKTRVSYLIFGFGSIMRKQFAKGIALLASQIIFWVYLINFGLKYLVKFNTLGTEKKGFNPDGTVKYGDNSFLILLYGLLTIVLILVYLTIWYINIRASYKEQKILEQGKALPTNKKFFSSLLDQNFDKTLLAIPVLGTFLFTALPIAFMICVAFTNYDYDHQAPAKLFTWVGFENFKNLFSLNTNGFGSTFFVVLAWTLVWAFFATFLNYFLGIAVALLINKKGIKFKKMWRTILITTIAVPQFVSLLYMYKLFASDGI